MQEQNNKQIRIEIPICILHTRYFAIPQWRSLVLKHVGATFVAVGLNPAHGSMSEVLMVLYDPSYLSKDKNFFFYLMFCQISYKMGQLPE